MILRELLANAQTGKPTRNSNLLDFPSSICHTQNKISQNALVHAQAVHIHFQAYNAGCKQPGTMHDELKALRDELKTVTQVLRRNQEQEDEEQEDNQVHSSSSSSQASSFALMFHCANGHVPILHFLMHSYFPSLANHHHHTLDPIQIVAVCCMQLLRELITFVPDLAEWLGNQDAIIVALLSRIHCNFPELAETSTLLCEDLLLRRSAPVFDLRNVHKLHEWFLQWNPVQLLMFCRLLGPLTMLPDERKCLENEPFKSFALLDLRRQSFFLAQSGRDVITPNFQFLFSECPLLLPRLVELLRNSSRKLWLSCKSTRAWRFSLPPPSSSSLHQTTTTSNTTVTSYLPSIMERFAISLNLRPPYIPPAIMATTEMRVEDDDNGDDDDYTNNEEYHDVASIWHDASQRDMWLLGQRLEAVYALCTCNVGPEKKFVQDTLREHGLMSAILHTFDALVWDPHFKPHLLPNPIRIHGANCECNPQQPMKCQLLRLVHNYCDRESDNRANKMALFSPEELAASSSWQLGVKPDPVFWRAIPLNAFSPPLDHSNAITANELMIDAILRSRVVGLPNQAGVGRGLAYRIAFALLNHPVVEDKEEKEEDGESKKDDDDDGSHSLKFWESAALESLLRGLSLDLKCMVCAWGVLPFAVKSLLREEETKRKDYFQSGFDLLAESIKDNYVALNWLCGSRRDGSEVFEPLPVSGDCFSHLCDLALEHLVDGNVFLRTIVLVVHRHRPHCHPKVLEWVDTTLFQVVESLFSVISVDTVGQDNLCCLNTAIVLCTFVRLKLSVQDMLEQQLGGDHSLAARRNFRALLWYWRAYYSCRAVDRKSLENSSGIRFDELQRTVSLLCEPGQLLAVGDIVHVNYTGNALPCQQPFEVEAWGEF